MSSTAMLFGCTRTPEPSAPISLAPSPPQIKSLPSAFPPVEPHEGSWAQERLIGRSFAKEGDFYRAITAFKRALILLPLEETDRRFELQYDILLSYCLAQRWKEAHYYFSESELGQVPASFPAHRDLLLLVQEIFLQNGNVPGAARVDQGLSPEDAAKSQLARSLALRQWDQIPLESFQSSWKQGRKSPEKAAFLQAIFPGAGYWYIGQTRAGITSFFLNALTTAATVTLATNHQWAAAALVGSLELGWYIGGMNGASLAAHQWNRALGDQLAYPILAGARTAALFRLEFSF